MNGWVFVLTGYEIFPCFVHLRSWMPYVSRLVRIGGHVEAPVRCNRDSSIELDLFKLKYVFCRRFSVEIVSQAVICFSV